MKRNHGTPSGVAQPLPTDLVSAVERTHAVLLDPDVAPIRRHEILVALVTRAVASGRLAQVRDEVARRRAENDLVMLPGDSGAMKRSAVLR